LTLGSVLLAAGALTHWVEQPALRWIRTRYKRNEGLAPK
jgi:hypothetical protein